MAQTLASTWLKYSLTFTSGILGHTNASFTLDTYTHVTTDMQKNAAVVVGDFIDELFGGEV